MQGTRRDPRIRPGKYAGVSYDELYVLSLEEIRSLPDVRYCPAMGHPLVAWNAEPAGDDDPRCRICTRQATAGRLRATCRSGLHAMTPDNVVVFNDGCRRCKACRALYAQAHPRKRRKAKAAGVDDRPPVPCEVCGTPLHAGTLPSGRRVYW